MSGKYPNPVGKPPVPIDPSCPRCGRPKLVKWNTQIGKWFFSCSGWPNACDWSSHIKWRWSQQFFDQNPNYPTRTRRNR